MIDIRKTAYKLGIDDVRIIEPASYPDWRESVSNLRKTGCEASLNLETDPHNLMSDVKSVIVLTKFYRPLKGWAKDSIRIHPYYIASNDLRNKTKAFVDELNKSGIKAMLCNDLPHRHAAFRAGLGIFSTMGPLINEEHGSYMAFRIILVDRELIYNEEKMEFEGCGNCKSCVKACPNDAITEDGIVIIDRCIRYYAPCRRDIPHSIRKQIGMDYIGCDKCMDACDYNKNIKADIVSDDLNEAMNLYRLLDYKAVGWRDRVTKLASLIGKNEARPVRLIASCAIHAGNSGDTRYIPLLKKALEYEDNRVRTYAVWALRELGDKDSIDKLKLSEKDQMVLDEINNYM